MGAVNSPLIILPTFRVKTLPTQTIVITRKFIEAVQQFEKFWPGPVRVYLEESPCQIDDVDQIEISLNRLPIDLKVVDYHSLEFANQLQGAVVLAAVSYRQNHISQLCQAMGAICIYTAEYTVQTRHQIVDANTRDPFLRLHRRLWELKQEIQQRRSLALAHGVHCNGLPVYQSYQNLTPHPHLFFDTRITSQAMAIAENLQQRPHWQQEATRPLNLVYSGRLNAMKGADHLVLLAKELKRLNCPFKLFISGAGPLEPLLQRQIQAYHLEDFVVMMGVPDYHKVFLPFVKAQIDIAVSCHPQGDPSCTYLEMMSCGIPLLGYANEALAGLVKHSGCGWLAPVGNYKAMAQTLAQLARDRLQVQRMALQSLQFAQAHHFEGVFQSRANHLLEVYETAEPLSNFRSAYQIPEWVLS